MPKQAERKTAKRLKQKQSVFRRIQLSVKEFLGRRPHRSFRLTRRRDYARSLKLPGYWTFTASVLKVMLANEKSLMGIGILYTIISVIFLGIGSQESFNTLRDTINETGAELFQGNWGELGKASLLAVSTIAGNISPELTEAQQVYAVILGLVIWLTTVWLLRQRLAGNKVGIRDALYSSGAPIVATAILFVVMMIQLLPIALAVIGYTAAQTSGLLSGGVEAMLFWIVAVGLAVLSLYWITSTFMAMVIVTLPGMYPFRALAIAGDMVVGRRLRIMYRLLWGVLLQAVLWITVLIPVVLLDTGLKHVVPAIGWLPIVPIILAMLSTVSLIATASYVYLLYRRVVDDDAKPA